MKKKYGIRAMLVVFGQLELLSMLFKLGQSLFRVNSVALDATAPEAESYISWSFGPVAGGQHGVVGLRNYPYCDSLHVCGPLQDNHRI